MIRPNLGNAMIVHVRNGAYGENGVNVQNPVKVEFGWLFANVNLHIIIRTAVMKGTHSIENT